MKRKKTQNIPFGVSNTNLISADLVNGRASLGRFSSFKIPIALFLFLSTIGISSFQQRNCCLEQEN